MCAAICILPTTTTIAIGSWVCHLPPPVPLLIHETWAKRKTPIRTLASSHNKGTRHPLKRKVTQQQVFKVKYFARIENRQERALDPCRPAAAAAAAAHNTITQWFRVRGICAHMCDVTVVSRIYQLGTCLSEAGVFTVSRTANEHMHFWDFVRHTS